jgi:hypothetical protein
VILQLDSEKQRWIRGFRVSVVNGRPGTWENTLLVAFDLWFSLALG